MSTIVCAIDTETTSVDMLKAEAVEIAIVPLNKQYEPEVQIPPLELLINPGVQALDEGAEALAFNKIGRDHILKDGLPKKDVLGFIKGWMYSYGITTIIPLGHNWSYDRVVINRLLTTPEAEKIFFRRSKDSHTLAVSVNDRYAFHGLPEPFKSTRLGDLAKQFGVSPEGAHRAKHDCIMCAKVYQELMKFPVPQEKD